MSHSQTQPQTQPLLPASLHMGPVTLAVSDLRQSVDFYSQVLGLRVLEQDGGEPATRTLGAGRTPVLHLHELPGARPQPPFSTGLYHVAIRVPSRLDLGRVLLNLARSRYPLGGFSDHLVSEAIYLDDPDGNGLEIYRDRPRSEWGWKDGQVVMATDPLDIDGIVATVPDPQAPFAGMADGTRVGHVHLRVADLGRAEAFYHGLLGFDVVARVPGALFVSAGGYHHHLGMNTWQSGGAPRPPADSAGLREFVIVLPEADARDQLAARLQAAAVPFERLGADLLADDPWGNRLRVAPEAR